MRQFTYETTSSAIGTANKRLRSTAARPPSDAARCRSAKPRPSALPTSRSRRSRPRNSRQSPAPRPPSHRCDVDDAVAHHAAVVEDVLGRHQPVADVKREQAILSGARDLRHQFRIPPDVIDVERDAEHAGALRIEPVADVERLLRRVHAGAVGGIHRMQRLDRERHVGLLRVFQHLGDAVVDLRPRAAISFEAALPGREYCGRPPTTSTRQGAPSALASSTARRLSSRASMRCAASAGNMPPRQ